MPPLKYQGGFCLMLDMNTNITIKNLTTFPVGFIRINGQGEVNIPPRTSILIDRAEVVSQVQSGSVKFCGENNDHSHPYIYILYHVSNFLKLLFSKTQEIKKL